MGSKSLWQKRMVSLAGATGGAMSALGGGGAPVPQSKMKMDPSAVRASTDEVLRPKRTVCEPGGGIDPRVPQNRTSISAERLQRGRAEPGRRATLVARDDRLHSSIR